MADAVVPRPRPEESLAISGESPPATGVRTSPAYPRLHIALWAGMVMALLGFLALGSVRIGAGNWIGRRMPIRDIWSRFLEYLADQGASPVLVVAVTAALAVAAVATGYTLWLALALRDADSSFSADESE